MVVNSRPVIAQCSPLLLHFQMLAECLDQCYEESKKEGSPLALTLFVSGRGRLEDEGAKALSEVFKVCDHLQ